MRFKLYPFTYKGNPPLTIVDWGLMDEIETSLSNKKYPLFDVLSTPSNKT